MAESGSGKRADVGVSCMGAIFEQRVCFRPEDEVLGGAKTGSPIDPIVHKRRSAGTIRAAGSRESDRVTDDVGGNWDFADDLLEREQILPGE